MYEKTIEAIKDLVNDGTVPGVSYAFIDDEQVRTGLYGAEALVPGYEPLKANQLYDVASLTKVVGTLNVILQLVDAGKLSLTDRVQDYLPNWQDTRVTIRHLLTHTSGIVGYIPHRDKLTASELHQALLGMHVGENFERKMVYSDVNFIFLGWIAEKILGEPIQTLITKKVLIPLGMKDSTFQPADPTQCVPTEVSPIRGLIRGVVHDPKAFVLKSSCGSAGLFSTLNDLVTFEQTMLSRENLPVAQPEKRALLADQTPLHEQWRSFGWALLQAKLPVPHRCIWHSGFTGTFLIMDLQTHQGMVFLSNRVHPKAPNEPFLARRNAIINTYLGEKSSVARIK
ncbi:beta-lactamase family protein [Lactobacillus sp. LC28-10]|uniref:Beta-lactamase family protein n=1 Tax=Secundilactobacillus angelensis TaxID=2722706 RepID=A0ABX1KWT6_9LACO|nr:serine hydrolase domain-containing protein [Secundilactobacillus angelensis]MCH5462117.1 beta-lactamase family protein [Secundilactobacillus angelensis]NLR18402.1 beta-lactamase family protein [Secundilactobacillus angelensis]